MPESFEQFMARVRASTFLLGDVPMAKAVKLGKGKEFQFKTTSGGESRYPWDEWFSGDLLMLEQSEGEKDEKGAIKDGTVKAKKDYETSTDAMPGKLKGAARRKYKVVQISRYDADGKKLKDALIIKARDMTPDERVAEDLKRAEEREARKAKEEADGATPAPDAGQAAPAADAGAPAA